MNFINPLSYDEAKLKFPSLVQDIQNSLFRFNKNSFLVPFLSVTV